MVVTAIYAPKRINTNNVEFSDNAVINVKISYLNEKESWAVLLP